MQQARGRAVWTTPEILTWEAWLARQWRAAALTSPMPAVRQLLGLSQERQLWESVLLQLSGQGADAELLRPHAAALMRAAARATQSLLALSRSAMTEEESLLATALVKLRAACAARGLLALQLAPPEELEFLAALRPPAIVGQARLTAMQRRLRQLYWNEAELLLAAADGSPAVPELRRAAHFEAEIRACARWCRDLLQQDGARRLLVLSVYSEPGAHTQGAMLWRELAGNAAGVATQEQQHALLAVEGGAPLHHQALVADALAALAVLGGGVETSHLLQLLRSPYFMFGSTGECAALQATLGELGLARWQANDLLAALTLHANRQPAAVRLLGWLERSRPQLQEPSRHSATGWAEIFSQCLQGAGFASAGTLDSRDAQRLARWSELLDEFAGLDAVLAPLAGGEAVQALQRLARQSSHQGATGDAAVTFSTQLHDPVAHYDGIWVMGLTENRWPEPPRPDPYIALSEQRRCKWPEAGVSQRLQAAQWLLQRWQLRTANLVLSYSEQEGDVRHRPSAVLPRAPELWVAADAPVAALSPPVAVAANDPGLPVAAAAETVLPLRGGVARLSVQQECAFHAQAQWRLGAEQPATLTDGIPARLRGRLLHTLLEGLWQELRDQRQLLGLTPAAQAALVERHWFRSLRENAAAGAAWLAPGVLAREGLRTARLLESILEIERARTPFVVHSCEREVLWHCAGGILRMRVDRIDQMAAAGYLLVDYKSGVPGSIRLHEGEARPLQLAAYVAALADTDLAVRGAVMLSLKPAQLRYSGASAMAEQLPGRVSSIEDWPAAVAQWRAQLEVLMQQHLRGDVTLAAAVTACRNCHLAALCRRSAVEDDDAAGDADADAEEQQ